MIDELVCGAAKVQVRVRQGGGEGSHEHVPRCCMKRTTCLPPPVMHVCRAFKKRTCPVHMLAVRDVSIGRSHESERVR